MSRLGPVRSSQVVTVLQRLQFVKIRQKGSHAFFRHTDRRCTVVPMHKGEAIGKGLLRQIMRDIDITPEEFRKIL